jgi:hypothetical protein
MGRAVISQTRRIGWVGLLGSGAVLALGLALVIGSAVAAGDWWLAREPWIGVGLTLASVGLGLFALCAVLLDIAEPIGAWRLLAVPPALLVGAFWAFVLVLGVPTTGFGGAERDVPTILYSIPEWFAALTALTIALPLPAIVRRRLRREANA